MKCSKRTIPTLSCVVARARSAARIPIRLVSSSAATDFSSLRRPRQYSGRFTRDDGFSAASSSTLFGKQLEPYELKDGDGNDNDTDAYLKKASLSPWVPMPDSVARKALDLIGAGPNDVHVDLGCGDGRVNFHAVDGFYVSHSLGVDIDANMIERAKERLAKRHPRPTNIDFVVLDVLRFDVSHEAWKLIQQRATIITMYFTQDALRKLRPVLEHLLVGRNVKIVTCGYEMPGWQSTASEVILGTQLHLYEWGSSVSAANDKEGDETVNVVESPVDMFVNMNDNDALQSKLDQLAQSHLEGKKFAGSTVIDRTNPHHAMLQGYNPDLKWQEEDDDEDWDAAAAPDDADTASKKGPPKREKSKSKTSNCSKR